jgi:alpha-tubulin suppressor-like RCC1 family protein
MRPLNDFFFCGAVAVFVVGSIAACGDSAPSGVGGSTSATSAVATTGASTSSTGGSGGGGVVVDPAVVSGADATHVCALRSDGAVVCWGSNERGQLGQGSMLPLGDQPGEVAALAPVDLGSSRAAVRLAVGAVHTCALLDDDSVKCWGGNYRGQLGLEDNVARGDGEGQMGDALPAVNLGIGRAVRAIAAGTDFTCAVLDDQSVKCWGFNIDGELGLGDTQNRGWNEGDMGDALPRVDLGAGKRAVTLAAGFTHTCALLDDGAVKCWGVGTGGQLGLGDTAARGDGPGEMGEALPAVDLGAGRKAVAIAAGSGRSCALLDDGRVKCWGSNENGELGLGDTESRGDSPGEMGDALPAVDLGQGRTAVGLVSGGYHVCALLDDSAVKCWGQGLWGQLGLGDGLSRGDEPSEMGDALPPIDLGTRRTPVGIAAGRGLSCALLDTDEVKCWGENFYGSLGLGDSMNRGDDPGEMGDQLPSVPLP